MSKKLRIGIVGTGFIGRGLAMALNYRTDMEVSRTLTRRSPDHCPDYPYRHQLTNSVQEFIDHTDIVVECSGDVIHATEVVSEVIDAGLPIVTMDAEFQVTTASYFIRKGLLTEAEGDQPGCLAALREDARQMGFHPLVYGNIKKFLNHHPNREEMRFWSTKQGISLTQVTAFTDGTKVQIEQALVANGLDADIAVPGLLGLSAEDVVKGATTLADGARRLGYPISDYLLSPSGPAGVFIAALHEDEQKEYLRYLKLGDGPYYVLLRSFHLCHLEIAKTIRLVADEGKILLNNGTKPRISVGAFAKRALKPGDHIERGIGSFDVRGACLRIAENPHHVPVGLLADAVVTRTIEKEQQITFDDIELPESLALSAWGHIRDNLDSHEERKVQTYLG